MLLRARYSVNPPSTDEMCSAPDKQQALFFSLDARGPKTNAVDIRQVSQTVNRQSVNSAPAYHRYTQYAAIPGSQITSSAYLVATPPRSFAQRSRCRG